MGTIDYSKKAKGKPRPPIVHNGDGDHRNNDFMPQMAHQLETQTLGNTARSPFSGRCPTCGK